MAIWPKSEQTGGAVDDAGFGEPFVPHEPCPASTTATDLPSDSTESLQTAANDKPVPTIQEQLKAIERRVKAHKKRLVISVLAIGEALTEAQALLASYKTGYFVRWMRENSGFSKKTGYAYMQAWRSFGHLSPAVANRIQLTAMNLLARDQTPPKAVEEAAEIAGDGKMVTAATARRLIAKHTVDSPQKPRKRPEPLILDVSGGAIIIRPAKDDTDVRRMLSEAMRQLRASDRVEAA